MAPSTHMDPSESPSFLWWGRPLVGLRDRFSGLTMTDSNYSIVCTKHDTSRSSGVLLCACNQPTTMTMSEIIHSTSLDAICITGTGARTGAEDGVKVKSRPFAIVIVLSSAGRSCASRTVASDDQVSHVRKRPLLLPHHVRHIMTTTLLHPSRPWRTTATVGTTTTTTAGDRYTIYRERRRNNATFNPNCLWSSPRVLVDLLLFSDGRNVGQTFVECRGCCCLIPAWSPSLLASHVGRSYSGKRRGRRGFPSSIVRSTEYSVLYFVQRGTYASDEVPGSPQVGTGSGSVNSSHPWSKIVAQR